MKKFIIKSIVIGCLFALPILSEQLYAQPVPPPSGGGNGGHGLNGDQQGAPLDGGISLLLALGVAYGGKKINSMRKDQKKDI